VEAGEEFAIEIGAAPFAGASILIEGVEGVPVVFLEVGAAEPLHRQPIGQRIAALSANGLALARGQGFEEFLEAGIALIVPVKLGVDALEPAIGLDFVGLGLGYEGGVHR